MTHGSAPTPAPSPAELRVAAGAFSRPTRLVVASLLGSGSALPDLVAATGVPRRRVEQLLDRLSPDLDQEGEHYRLRADRQAEYRDGLAVGELDRRRPDDVVATALAEHPDLVTTMIELGRTRPRPRRDLDHVAATAETAARRALWLDATFDLAQTRLLCVGDHDLTSLAVAAHRPETRVTVADVDDRLLEFIDRSAHRHGWNVHCVWGDFSLGLPPSLAGGQDIAFTDPPYTPEGVSLFLATAMEGLADQAEGRVVVAYGHGEHQPALGLKVQQAMLDLHVVFEAILPGFNHYHGAQAIGSRSDLYVCRPTARSWRALPKAVENRRTRIYTHGARSVESDATAAGDAPAQAVRALGPRTGHLMAAGDRWPSDPRLDGAQRTSVARLIAGGTPHQLSRPDLQALVDLGDAPPSWLVRLLLATNAGRLVALAPAGIGAEVAGLLADKYTIRTAPASGTRLEVLTAVATQDGPGVARAVLHRAHGLLGNVWREALIREARSRGETLTKNEARAIVNGAVPRPDVLATPLVELPTHLLGEVTAALRAPTTT